MDINVYIKINYYIYHKFSLFFLFPILKINKIKGMYSGEFGPL